MDENTRHLQVHHNETVSTLYDFHIRAALLRELEEQYRHQPDTVIIGELGIDHGKNRIDLAVINDAMHGYEIKSDRDTLTRLTRQSQAYTRVFDYLTLIASDRHLSSAAALLPRGWGLTQVSHDGRQFHFNPVREARLNQTPDVRTLLSLLWREETWAILESRSLGKGLKSATRSRMWTVLEQHLSLPEVQQVVRETMHRRKQNHAYERW